MSFLEKILGKKDDVINKETKGIFSEKDNAGMRFDTYEQAEAYWINRNVTGKFVPFLIFIFTSGNEAREALLALDCMHVASDSGKIICTETLFYGFFKDLDGKFNAIICGEDISHDLWISAKDCFIKHGGKLKTEKEPEVKSKKNVGSVQGSLKKVKFIREDQIPGTGGIATYRIYQAPDAISAKAFLQEEPVIRNLYYVVVETPEGNYGRDIQGIYKE